MESPFISRAFSRGGSSDRRASCAAAAVPSSLPGRNTAALRQRTPAMEAATLQAYDRDARAFADEWDGQPAPSDLHAAVRRFFIPGGATADIGCGSGRDA